MLIAKKKFSIKLISEAAQTITAKGHTWTITTKGHT
jgi:hypothetical protein